MSSYRGLLSEGGVVRTRRPRLTIDENNLRTLREEYECDDSILFDILPNIDDPHPEFPQLVCKHVEPEFLQLRKGRYRARYQGIVFTGGIPGLPAPRWSIDSVANEEDIRSFIFFGALEAFADGFDGVVTDDDGLFVGFSAPGVEDVTNPAEALRGVQSFLAPSVVISVVRYSIGPPSGGAQVGKIDNPGGPLAGPNSSGNQNWLKIGFSSEDFGETWQTRESWLRSGAAGWNPMIYG